MPTIPRYIFIYFDICLDNILDIAPLQGGGHVRCGRVEISTAYRVDISTELRADISWTVKIYPGL